MIDWIGKILKEISSPLTRVLAYYRIPPNAVTIGGFILSIVSAYFYTRGLFLIGGIVLLLSGLLDMIDGELSRLLNLETRFGAFLDSTLDRISECIIFLGIAIFLGSINFRYIVLVILALSGSLMVSYTRARAEGLDVPGRVGIFERGVRFFFLLIGYFFGPNVMVYILVILILGTLSTIIQRMIFVYHKCR